MIAQEAITYLDRRLAAGGLTTEYDERMRKGRLKEKLRDDKAHRMEEATERDVYIIWSASKVVLEENWVKSLKEVLFEGLDVATFGKAKEYLKRHYRDNFMEVPSDEMRRVGLTRIEW